MKKYTITIKNVRIVIVDVEAENRKRAVEMAMEKMLGAIPSESKNIIKKIIRNKKDENTSGN